MDDLVGHVSAQVDVGRSAVDPPSKVVVQFDVAPIIEPEQDLDRPGVVAIPRFVTLCERQIRGLDSPSCATHAGDSEAQRRVPGRLAGLVRPDDDGHAGREFEGLIVKGAERVGGDAFDAHVSQRPSRRARRAHGGRR